MVRPTVNALTLLAGQYSQQKSCPKWPIRLDVKPLSPTHLPIKI